MMNTQARIADYLRLMQQSGSLVIPSQRRPVVPEREAPPQATARDTAVETIVEPPPSGKPAALEALAGRIRECEQCALHVGRKNAVPGEGSAEARVVFVGEAPGFDEDRTGRPFVGRAGELLTNMIAAMCLRREDVFICNVLKCRPPGNRDPQPEEMAACEAYLQRQLDIIQPRIIVALGRYASQRLLNSTAPISRLRGQWSEYNGIPLMPTFHPSYLLRSPGEKVKAWEDLQKVMAEYERLVGPLPGKQ